MSAFGVGEKGDGGPDKTKGYKLNQAKAFMEEKDAQKQCYGRADILYKAQHVQGQGIGSIGEQYQRKGCDNTSASQIKDQLWCKMAGRGGS